MLTHDSGYRFSVGNSSSGEMSLLGTDGWREALVPRAPWTGQSHAPEEVAGAGGREQAAPDRHGPDV